MATKKKKKATKKRKTTKKRKPAKKKKAAKKKTGRRKTARLAIELKLLGQAYTQTGKLTRIYEAYVRKGSEKVTIGRVVGNQAQARKIAERLLKKL